VSCVGIIKPAIDNNDAPKMKQKKPNLYILCCIIWGGCLLPVTVWTQQKQPPAAPVVSPPYASPPSPPSTVPPQTATNGNPTLSAPANYRIQPDDVLEIRVFREPDLYTTARVANDGTIMVPLAGQLRVGGLSVSQAAKAIQAKLAAGYLPNPQVTVNITQFHHRRFTILGQVNRSGTFDFPDEGPLGLLQAIGLAGGYTSIADPSKVIIRRIVNGKVTSFRINAKKLATGRSDQDVQVMPGDVITVSEAIF
jgi:protein involved in polysaccharide export with SLBB domain